MIKKSILHLIIIYFIFNISNAATLTQENKLVIMPANEMTSWGKPKTLPSGAHDYLLSGNPGKPEIYTFRFQLPVNYKIPPFSLTSTCYLTVVSGKLYIGEGDKFGKNNQHFLPAGSFVVIPAHIHLYFWTKEKTILQFNGIGPLDINYANASDDPRSTNK